MVLLAPIIQPWYILWLFALFFISQQVSWTSEKLMIGLSMLITLAVFVDQISIEQWHPVWLLRILAALLGVGLLARCCAGTARCARWGSSWAPAASRAAKTSGARGLKSANSHRVLLPPRRQIVLPLGMQRIMDLLWPGAMALLIAGLFVATAGIFLLALQYHKHGRLSWRRTITSSVVVLYVFGLLSYTMLPMPETRDAFCRPGVAQTQLEPFHFFQDFNLAWEGGRRAFLTSFELWQVLFNVLLFIPVGILAIRWARQNVFTGTLIGFTLSLAIEATQYTGIWGIYTCAYRVADVDDLIVNTFGAFLGTLLAYLPVFAFLSGPSERDGQYAPARAVTRSRRRWRTCSTWRSCPPW